MMSYGRLIDRLIKEQYDLDVTPQTERQQVKTKGRLFSNYARTEKQNGLFHTHKFNPKMLCHCRGLTVGKKKHKETEQIKRVAPFNI